MVSYNKRLAICAVLAMWMGFFVPGRAFGTVQYRITDLGTLGGSSSFAASLNNYGQVTGYSYTATDQEHAFLYNNGVMTDLQIQGGYSSRGYGINDSGQVTGEYRDEAGSTHPFVRGGSSYTYFTFNGGGRSINNIGQITGWADHGFKGNPFEGGTFLYTPGVDTPIVSDGTSYTMIIHTWGIGYSINNSGQVAGWDGLDASFLYSNGQTIGLGLGAAYAVNNSGQVTGDDFTGIIDMKAFLYSNEQMLYLDNVTGRDSAGYGINDSGDVTGAVFTGLDESFAFIYKDGIMTDLNTLIDPVSGWTLASASDINNAGQICGYGITPQGQTHGFLLTPIPEPATLCLLALGGLILARRKNNAAF